ncbi:hypothetical protein [Actinomadura bangladeshensis]|nr:hypothetical protein [Actinomadura bangladeshensis]
MSDAPYTDLFVVSDRAGRGTNFATYCAGPAASATKSPRCAPN